MFLFGNDVEKTARGRETFASILFSNTLLCNNQFKLSPSTTNT